jgi:nucleotide-binding universal stress UspA family protein
MKTILVLTDFSIKADHAAHYALKLATKIKANLLLCNVFLIPSTTAMGAQIAWPMENYDTLEEDSVNDLTEFIGRLNNELDIAEILTDAFRPQINQCSKAGFVVNTIDDIVKSHNVMMVVIGTHSHKGLNSFLAGDHARDVIERANCPVLLIPEQALFKNYRKIAFATDLSHNDIEVLHSLAGLAKFYNSEIMITHIAEENTAYQLEEPDVKIFLNMVSSKINYPNIYYRPVRVNILPIAWSG